VRRKWENNRCWDTRCKDVNSMALKTTTFRSVRWKMCTCCPPCDKGINQVALRHHYTFSRQHIIFQKTMTFTIIVLETSDSHRWYQHRVMTRIFGHGPHIHCTITQGLILKINNYKAFEAERNASLEWKMSLPKRTTCMQWFLWVKFSILLSW